MNKQIKTIFKLLLWAVVIASCYYGYTSFRAGIIQRKHYLNELHDMPCEFTLDATQENHLQVPFHHTFDGLHGCVLCIRKSALHEELPELTDASFMEFSLLDGETVIVKGDNDTPCQDIWLEYKTTTDQPLAYLWRSSPDLPHKDYILDVKVTKTRSESACAELPIVVRYNPCGMINLGAWIAKSIGIGLWILALGLGGGMIARIAWKILRRKQ